MSQLFTSDFKSTGASALVLPINNQGWFPLRWTGWISLQSKGLSRVFSNTTVESINSSALSLFYGSTPTYVHDHWRNHSFAYMDFFFFFLVLNIRLSKKKKNKYIYIYMEIVLTPTFEDIYPSFKWLSKRLKIMWNRNTCVIPLLGYWNGFLPVRLFVGDMRVKAIPLILTCPEKLKILLWFELPPRGIYTWHSLITLSLSEIYMQAS